MTPQDVLKQYESRINLHQFDAVAPLIAEDAVVWFNDGSFAGHEAIRGAFERTWASLADETYWLTDLRWIAVGDVAASCIYQFNWRTTVDGQEASGVGPRDNRAPTGCGWLADRTRAFERNARLDKAYPAAGDQNRQPKHHGRRRLYL